MTATPSPTTSAVISRRWTPHSPGATPDGDLAALAVVIRDERPRPDAGVVARLDARAEAGFAEPRAAAAGRRPLLPALGVAGALVLALVVGTVVLRDGDGADRRHAWPSRPLRR